MKVKKIRSRINPAELGVEVENDIESAPKQEDGSIDLSDVYDVPPPVDDDESKARKAIQRAAEKAGIADEKAYHKEYKLRAAHQILINGGSVGKIAELLKISITEAKALRNELNARLVREVKTLDKNRVAGQALMFYDAMQAKFLQMAQVDPQHPNANLRSKIEALKGALQSQTDKQKFLKEIGFWKEPINSGDAADAHTDGANTLRDMAENIISGTDFDFVDEDEGQEEQVELLN